MINLISGKEALVALANGEDVQYIASGMAETKYWSDSEKTKNFTIHDFYSGSWVFRLKPKTILINGVEVPAPFKPKEGEQFFILDDSDVKGYVTDFYSKCDYANANFIGMWRTEEEIKQVIEALRKVFNHE